MGHYLFGFSGRINRAKMWAFLLVVLVLHIVSACAAVGIIGPQTIFDVVTQKVTVAAFLASGAVHTAFAVSALIHLLLLFMLFAVVTKRLHDRDKSAWWLFVFLVLPIALNIPRQIIVLHMMFDQKLWFMMRHGGVMMLGGPGVTLMSGIGSLLTLWAIVELGFFRGTVGDNRYGADPLHGRVAP